MKQVNRHLFEAQAEVLLPHIRFVKKSFSLSQEFIPAYHSDICVDIFNFISLYEGVNGVYL